MGRASSARATGRAPPGPWGDGRRPAPGTPSPIDTAETPEMEACVQRSRRYIKSGILRFEEKKKR